MPTAWRLTKTKHLTTAWDGEGARLNGGRWNSKGTAVVYVASTLALALVETLVHLSPGVLPAYSAVPVDFDWSLVAVVDLKDLAPDWTVYPPPASTQSIGDNWVTAGKSVALRVPSVVVPLEFNFLLNPRHPDFHRLHIGTPMPLVFDARIESLLDPGPKKP